MFAYVLIFLEFYYVLTVADKPERRYEIKIGALESQRSRDVCFIDDLDKQIDGWDDLSCNNYGKENFVPEGTYCHVYQEDLIFEYHCLEGTWKPSTGTDVHIRSKRWTWLLYAVVIVAVMVVIGIVYNHPNSNTNSYPSVRNQPPVFSEPCRPENLLPTYIADSKQTKVNVTWSDPVATDDVKVVKNEQTGGIMKANEFPGSPSPGTLHEVTYTATDDKGLRNTCTFDFTVIYLTCNEPSIPAHGRKISCPDNYIYGGQCTFECDIGYEMIGENTATCLKNQTWENIPSCRKKLCSPPFNISNGYVICEDTTHPYDEDCDFVCNQGFRLNGSRKMTCRADQTWSVNASDVFCEDDKPPVIECQSPQVFYADRGGFNTSVSWITPSASDNVDSNPVIEKLSGPSQGDVLTEGYHRVVYKSTDMAGNSHATLSKCTIILEVKVIKCATGPTDAIADSKFMKYTCSDAFFYNGVSCNLDCLLNLPLNGTDLVNCERDGNTSKGIWNWGPGTQPFCQVGTCPDLDAPANGGFTTDTILGRPLHVMFCRKGYDIATITSRNGIPFAGWLSCHDNGQWFPLDSFPDCVVSNLPWLTVPAELYYAGDCNNESTTSLIKRQALSYLSNIQTDINNSICPNPNTCKVENLAVMCGNMTARKRRETAPHWLTKRQTGYALVTWEIKVLFDRGNRTTQTAYSDLLVVLNEIKDVIQTGVTSGNFDIENFILPDDAFQTATDPGLACEPGYRRDSESVVCKPCPTGTFLNSTTGNCEYCHIGEYMDHEGALLCDQCPDGYSTLATGSKDMHKCIKMCPPGFFSSSTLEPCSACPLGTFQPERGQEVCQICPQGTATNSTNSTSHLDCQLFDIFVGQMTQRTSLGSFDFRGISVISTSLWIKPLGSEDTGNLTLYFANSDGDIITISASNFVEITIGTSLPVRTSLTLSRGHWTHITTIVDILAGGLEVYINGLLVVDVTGNFNVTLNELDVDFRSYSDGFYLSGLSVYPRKFTRQDMTALTELCSVSLGDAIITMSDILNNIVPGITLVIPTSCDPIDECENRTCGEHICINQVDGFQCVCLGGMTGVLCDIPPDYCLNNQCVHGDCFARNETYTCSCNDGFTGVFCDKPPVDGSWSDWSFWSECSVTCEGGTRFRTRSCNNPPPGYLGQDCLGNDEEHEPCSTSQCPECPALKRKFGTIVTCVWNTQENRKECNMTCINGKLLPNGQKPFEKYWCGSSTNYTWVPTDKIPECVDAVRPDIFGIEMSVSYNTSVRRSDEITVQTTVKDRLSIIPCVEQTSCNMTTYFSSNSSRQRRESTTTLSLQLAVTLKDDGDLALEDYLATGTVSSAMGELLDSLQAMKTAIEFIQNDTASIFDLTVDGVNYAIDNNLTAIVAMVTCAEGMAGADGVCVKCAAGTREDELLCIDCEPGTYQPLTGQIKCIPCSIGFTTASYGASSISDCSVELPRTHDDEEFGYVRDEVGLNLAMIIVVVVLSVAIFLILVAVVAVVTWKKFSRKNTRNKIPDSFASLIMMRLFTTENQYSTNLLKIGQKWKQ